MRQSRASERTISIEEQRRDIHRWAKGAGVELAAEIVEQNVSGSTPWRVRALGEAIVACEAGEAAGIIVAWQDRLSRENGSATAEVWEAFEAAGARLVCAAEGLDTATGDHELTFSIKAAIAREQWKRHRANWERTRRNSVGRGVFPGTTPIGYRYRKGSGRPLEVDKREARKVQEAFELRAQGVPFSVIARRFGWSNSATRHVLANEAYLGVVRHGPFRNENAHPPIVSREVFDAVQAARTIQPPPAGATTRDRLLVGLARCRGCGATLQTVRREASDGSYVPCYYCVDRGREPCPDRAWVRAVNLDEFVADWFAGALRKVPRMVDVVAAGRDLEKAQAEQAQAEAKLNAYVENEDSMEPRDFLRGYEARKRRVQEANENVRQLSARLVRMPEGGPLITLWERFDALERREVLASFVDRIEVAHGASDDLPGHVRILWADGTVAQDDSRVRKAAA
jgi:DNA invertase Pin-like site-specific DNA recombinase